MSNMSLRLKTTDAIQKAGQALNEANAAITKAFQEQREYVMSMDIDVLTSPDASAALKDMLAIAALCKEMQTIENSLKAVYVKSLVLSSPASTVLIGNAKLGSSPSDSTATEIAAKESKRRGRRPKPPVVAPSPLPNKRGRKPKGVTQIPNAQVGRALPTKFRGPNGEEWSGRGSTPRWLASLETQGRSRAEFLANA